MSGPNGPRRWWLWAIPLIAVLGIGLGIGYLARPTATAPSVAVTAEADQHFRDDMRTFGLPDRAIEPAVAAAHSNCKVLTEHDGSMGFVIEAMDAGGLTDRSIRVTLLRGMATWICPQYRQPISGWVSATS